MLTPENAMTASSQRALQDMVELEMYLVAKPQQTPWPMLPRRCKKPAGMQEPHSSVVESSAVRELVDQGFIEPSSSRTFVVSKIGYQFYELRMKPNLA